MTCSRSIGDQGLFGSKLPLLNIIDYVFVNNWFFFKARESGLKIFYKRKLAFDISVVSKHILLFLIPDHLHFFSLPKDCLSAHRLVLTCCSVFQGAALTIGYKSATMLSKFLGL